MDEEQPLGIRLDPASPVPPFEQIRAQVARWIGTGALPVGSALPSVRQLARDLGVAANTVVRAYDELERAGWIAAESRRGFIVATPSPTLTPDERSRMLSVAVADLIASAHQLRANQDEVIAAIKQQWPR